MSLLSLRGRWSLVVVIVLAGMAVLAPPLLAQPPPKPAPAVPPAQEVAAMLQREPITPESWPAWRERLAAWLPDRNGRADEALRAGREFARSQADAAGELPGEKRFTSPKELKAIIAERKAELTRNLTQRLLAYALCRPLEGYDEIVVDQLMQTIARDGYRMQTLIAEIVTSYPFLNHRIQKPVSLSSNGK